MEVEIVIACLPVELYACLSWRGAGWHGGWLWTLRDSGVRSGSEPCLPLYQLCIFGQVTTSEAEFHNLSNGTHNNLCLTEIFGASQVMQW